MRIVCLTQRAWARRASVCRSRRIVALVGCLALALLGSHVYADTDTAVRHFDIQSQVAALALNWRSITDVQASLHHGRDAHATWAGSQWYGA